MKPFYFQQQQQQHIRLLKEGLPQNLRVNRGPSPDFYATETCFFFVEDIKCIKFIDIPIGLLQPLL